MASKVIYSVIAVVGIAGASGAAYWFQNKPTVPTEITGAGAAASAPVGGASGSRGPVGPGGPAGVEVAKVEVAKLQDDAQSVGSLRSRQNVMLRPEVAGRILTLGFTDGGRVRKGDVLVQLDDVLQRAEVRQSEAQMSIARANLKRNQELVAQNFVAQRVLDESSASLQVAEAQVALSCARWERMRMLAPFDATAGIRNVNIGDYVKDGADLVNIEDLSSMYVDFKLPERFQNKVRKDQVVELQLDAMPGRQFKAKIEAIDPQIDANGRSISVRAVMPNSGGEPLARPAGAGGPTAGASAARGGASAAGGSSGAKPAVRPVAKPVQRPASSPGSGMAGAPARPTDATVTACAPFSAAGRLAAANMGASAGLGVGGGAGGGAGASGTAGQGAGRANGQFSGVGVSNAAGTGTGGRPAAALTAPVTPVGKATTGGGRSAGPGPGPGMGGGMGGGPLRPGMFARVTTVFSIKENSLTVPEEAIVPQGGRQFVIKVVEQTEAQAKVLAEAVKVAAAIAAASAPSAGSSAVPSPAAAVVAAAPPSVFVDGKRLVSQRVEVKIGIRRPGRVELTEGVAEGETVVIAGQQRLQRDNTPVRVVDLGRPGGGQGGSGQGGQGGPGGQTPAASASGAPKAAGAVNLTAPASASSLPAASPAVPSSATR